MIIDQFPNNKDIPNDRNRLYDFLSRYFYYENLTNSINTSSSHYEDNYGYDGAGGYNHTVDYSGVVLYKHQFDPKNPDMYVNVISSLNDQYQGRYRITAKNRMVLSEFLKYVNTYMLNVDRTRLSIKEKCGMYEYPLRVYKTDENTFLPKQLLLLKDQILTFVKNKDLYIERGIPYKLGILLHGSPGTGKTSLAYYIANLLHWNIYRATIDDLVRIKQPIVQKIVLIDDIDRQLMPYNEQHFNAPSDLLPSTINRQSIMQPNESHQYAVRPQISPSMSYVNAPSELLSTLDGYSMFHQCIIIATTNNLHKIDPAIVRPGRFDHVYKISNIEIQQLKNIFKLYYDVDLTDDQCQPIVGKLTTSDVINRYVLPNEDYQQALNKLVAVCN